MNGIIVPLRRKADRQRTQHESARGRTPAVTTPDVSTILSDLRGKRCELLTVIEGLRTEAMRSAFGGAPFVAELDTLACRALANIDLLIHGAENMIATAQKA